MLSSESNYQPKDGNSSRRSATSLLPLYVRKRGTGAETVDRVIDTGIGLAVETEVLGPG
jgi:hypothetical protein